MANANAVRDVLNWLERTGKPSVREGMSRFAIPSDHAFGIPVGDLRKYARTLGKNHTLALELWKTGRYEARLLACFVDDPDEVTLGQMDDWCRDFDNWAVCDTACFHLFDRTRHAWKKIEQWSKRKAEFEKRAGFALLASVALHDRDADTGLFVNALESIESGSTDARNFVKKGVSWALRGIGGRNPELYEHAIALAEKLAHSDDKTARWIGKDALKDLGSAASQRRLQRKRKSQ